MHWQETTRILGRAARLAAVGQRAALATVIRIEGSAYRRPGAKLLVAEDGAMTGSVSGGCLEADVRDIGLKVLRAGVPELLHYDTGADDQTVWGLGLGCNGSVDIFVQPATEARVLEWGARALTLLQGDAAFAISTIVSGPDIGSTSILERDRVARDLESTLEEQGPRRVFTEFLTPPPHLFIFGAGDDAIPLATFAAEAGFRITVLDHRPAYVATERFPEGTRLVQARAENGVDDLGLGSRSCAIVMTHSLKHDREWVRHLAASPVAYIGILGPRARTDEIIQQVGAPAGERVFGPVGLDLGAEGAAQVALSITAELLAVWSGREPRHLRDKAGAIHG